MDDRAPQTFYRSIARNASWLSLSVGLTMVLALLLRMLLPRILGPEKLGVFYFADSCSALFFAFLPLGLTTYINRIIPTHKAHTKLIFSSLLLLEVFMAIFIGLVMLMSLVASGKDPQTILISLYMAVFAAIFCFQRAVLHKIFLAMNQVELISLINVVVKLILVGACLFILSYRPSVLWVAAMYAGSECIGLLILLIIAKRQGFFAAKPSLEIIRPILKFSLPFYLAGVLSSVYAEVDTNMLAHLANNLEVGYFGAAFKFVGVFMLMVPILQNAMTPALSQSFAAANGSFEILVRQLFHFILVLSLFLSTTLAVYGDVMLELLSGKGFEPSYKILCFLTPVLTMMYLNTFMAIILHLVSSGAVITWIFALGIGINIAVDCLVIPYGLRQGVGQAGLAVSFCTFLCEIYAFFAMLKFFPVKLFDAKLAKNIVVVLLPCWLAMIFYDALVSLHFWQRLLLLSLTPIYALLTRLVSFTEVKAFLYFATRALKT